jgi:hypothetical protein
MIIYEKGNEYRFNLNNLNNIRLFYGGYKGEMHEFEIFITGSYYRDGTKNYLIVSQNNEKKVQLFLKNKEESKIIKSFFDDLNQRGIDSRVIKKSFSVIV